MPPGPAILFAKEHPDKSIISSSITWISPNDSRIQNGQASPRECVQWVNEAAKADPAARIVLVILKADFHRFAYDLDCAGEDVVWTNVIDPGLASAVAPELLA